MRRYNDALDALRFTEEEQEMLIRKLEQAANAAQQPRRRRHPLSGETRPRYVLNAR